MGSILKKSGTRFLVFQYVNAQGKKIQRASEYTHDQEDRARVALDHIEAQIRAGVRYSDPATGRTTLRYYAEEVWLPRRQQLGVASWKNDRGRLRKHVIPKLGNMELRQIRAWHLRDLFDGIRTAGQLKGKTIWNVYAVVKALFRDARIGDLVVTDPCVLGEHELGRQVEHDTMERAAAVYLRSEIRALISDERIRRDRRVLYALEFFGRMRKGEAFAVCWRHLSRQDPLDMLTVSRSHGFDRTKTGMRRYVPIHPTLSAMLAEWALIWPALFGRAPGPDDLIVPVVGTKGKGSRLATGARRTSGSERAPFARDLATLGIPHRRRHDLGSAMITLSEADGADPDRLEEVTHTSGRSKRGAFSGYLRRQWPTLCAEVAKLQLTREVPELLSLGLGGSRAEAPAVSQQPQGLAEWRRGESNPSARPQRASVVDSDDVISHGCEASAVRERLRASDDFRPSARSRKGPGGRPRAVAASLPRPSTRGGGR